MSRNAWAGAALGAVAGLVALGPVTFRRGYVLSYDMVFAPRMPVTATTWGTDGSVPRAVPEDLLVALASHLVPGDLIQKCVLLAVFVVGAAGAARLVPSLPGGLAAGLVYVWNPWVRERLVVGHWPYLLGLAVLPWAVQAAGHLRRGSPGATASTATWVVIAALCGSTSGLVVGATALVVAGWPGITPWRHRARSLALGVVLPVVAASMVWVLPSVLRPGGIRADPAGIAAFAARADTRLGTWGSLVTLGGFWNPATWPSERRVLVLACAVLAVVVASLLLAATRLVSSAELPFGPGLLASGCVGLLLAGAGATPGLATILRNTQAHVVGGGILRDGQKFLVPFVLLVAVSVGLSVERLIRVPRLAPLAVLLVAIPVVVLPSLAWGVGGRLSPVHYPSEWLAVRDQVAALPGRGDVVSLPFAAYRRPDWNHDRITLDPMPRMLDRVVLVNDDLPLTGGTVHGENQRAAAVSTAIRAGEPLAPVLRAQGIGLAVVDLTAPGADQARSSLIGLPVLHAGPGLLLVDTSPAGPAPGRPTRLVVGATIGWLFLAAAIAVVAAVRVTAFRRRPVLTSGVRTEDGPESLHDAPG